MLNNVNNRGLSKMKKVDVLNLPVATSIDILTKTDDVLDKKTESIIIHVITNNLTNDVNLLLNVKRHPLILHWANHISSNFLKAVFHKFYLVHSWILCPIWTSKYQLFKKSIELSLWTNQRIYWNQSWAIASRWVNF